MHLNSSIHFKPRYEFAPYHKFVDEVIKNETKNWVCSQYKKVKITVTSKVHCLF